jgi:HK97 family phage prohead protease
MQTINKLVRIERDGEDFVLSDDTPDRVGDVIDPSGWVLAHFKRNPIMLFNHNQDFPIGRWENVRVEGGKLKAQPVLAEEGTSARIDEIRRLFEQKILRTASVGFKPLKAEPRDGGSGVHFLKQELLETSLVSVPANPNAIQLAKSLGASNETLALVFGENAVETERSVTGKPATKLTPTMKGSGMSDSIAKRVEDTQARLVAYQDELKAHLDNIGDEPSDDDNTVTEELNSRIETTQKTL